MREDNSMHDKIETITQHYTFSHQRKIFVEECAEAIQAACKVERTDEPGEYLARLDDLISEVADVLIMAQQMRLYLGAGKVDEEVRFKLDRQLQRIEEEEL